MVPVAVVPKASRLPSWNTHTSAPNDAVSDRRSSTSAFSGNTTLPVSRKSNTKVITAISDKTKGIVLATASALSRLI